MPHASLRKVGPVERGAAGLIAAQLAAVGLTGTLLMVLLGAAEDEPFDAPAFVGFAVDWMNRHLGGGRPASLRG